MKEKEIQEGARTICGVILWLFVSDGVQRNGSTRPSVQQRRGSNALDRRTAGPRRTSAMMQSQSGRSTRRSTRKSSRYTSGTTRESERPRQVRDEYGNDVTPRPLTNRDTASKGGAAAGDMSSPNLGTSAGVGADRSSARTSSHSGRDSSSSIGTADMDLGDDEMQAQEDEEDEAEEQRREDEEHRTKRSEEQLKQIKAEVCVPSREGFLSQDELKRVVPVQIEETDTIWMLDKPSLSVPLDSAEPNDDPAGVKRYRAVQEEYRSSEKLAENSAQTLASLMKHKEVQTSTASTKESAAQVNAWDIYDRLREEEEAEEVNDDLLGENLHFTARTSGYSSQSQSQAAGVLSQSFTASQATATQAHPQSSSTSETPRISVISTAHEGSALSQSTNRRESQYGAQALGQKGADATGADSLEGLVNLPWALEITEKAIAQNANHVKLLVYHDVRSDDALKMLPSDKKEDILHLFDFESPVTEGRNVACMAWNKEKPEMLAVGYGQLDFTSQRDGMIAIWSLKNPQHPKIAFRTSFGVTAIDFSELSPSLFGVGFYNGTVAVYDVRIGTNEPIMESGHSSGQHSDPVWQLQWVKQSSNQSENLVSISTDGRVTNWSIRKGLEYMDLMELKRVSKTGGAKKEAFISRRSSGMCFDFHPNDSNLYLAGTEDGAVHKCSCSYKEQYLRSYTGHAAPVYSAKWSPFKPKLFLTASADWTAKLWDEETKAPLMTFQSGTEEVTDMAWCPTASTVFGTTTRDGRVEVWDISASTLHPVLKHTQESERANCLLFSDNSPVLLVGGSSSKVHAFRLVGIQEPNTTVQQQVQVLEDALDNNVFSGPLSAGR